MTYKYKLCITIPTYNREKYLERLLNSIVSQESFSDEISIVINDGPSKDNTEKMVNGFQKKYKNIFYYRNEKAVGMLPAILESMEMSNGEYTRLFGSDDFMSVNALGNVLQCINKYNPKIIYSKRKEIRFGDKIEEDNGKLQILSFYGMHEFLEYLGDKKKGTFHDKDVLFTFMSGFSVNTDYYKKSYINLISNIGYSEEELKKNYFNFNLVALTNINRNDIITIVNNPICVYCELNNHGWVPNEKISQDLKYLTKYMCLNYSISFKCKIFLKKMNFCWYLSCQSKMYHFFIKILKRFKLYESLGRFWRGYVLGNK